MIARKGNHLRGERFGRSDGDFRAGTCQNRAIGGLWHGRAFRVGPRHARAEALLVFLRSDKSADHPVLPDGATQRELVNDTKPEIEAA